MLHAELSGAHTAMEALPVFSDQLNTSTVFHRRTTLLMLPPKQPFEHAHLRDDFKPRQWLVLIWHDRCIRNLCCPIEILQG